MASGSVSRIPLNDSPDEYILINTTSNGPASDDLKLIATEGQHPYLTTIKNSQLSKLQVKNSPVQELEWKTIVRAAFLHQRVEGEAAEVLSHLDVSASINGNKLIIVFRKKISGITQRIGEVSLEKDEEQEIDTIGWISIAVKRADGLETEVNGLETKVKEQVEVIHRLSLQLEDLIRAKIEHENSLLEKFRDLLNTKKLKIRDQQRLLASSKVDREKATQVQALRSNLSAADPPALSKPKKRKPLKNISASPSSSEDDDFETMNLDKKASPPVLDGDEHKTPEKSDLDEASTPVSGSDEETSGEDDEL